MLNGLLILLTVLSQYSVKSRDLSLAHQCNDTNNTSQLVTHLVLSGCATMANLPNSVEVLVMTKSNLAELEVEDISVLTRLRVLDLSSNKIVRIPSRIFRSNRRLRRLNLARNLISFLTRQSFLGKRRFISILIFSICIFQVFITWNILTFLTMTSPLHG